MITYLTRAAAAAMLALASLTVAAPAHAVGAAPVDLLTLPDAVAVLPVVEESQNDTYDRARFKHWNKGLNPTDGCNTRNEVLIAEAVEAPAVGANCALTGGVWWSYYDETEVTSASGLDIDHMVPLKEAWGSGAWEWTAERREAYANDQGAAVSLIAVTARSNRAKADKDPAQWMPPASSARCRYAAEWTATKLRWNLSVDQAEADTLQALAAECPGAIVEFEPAE
ncbi:HNH endonuclease family protein [Streptomyces sp. NPDC014746]|uniref:HNH endonuclease family protein n=1 Tax=Streptomyces sp. NPDC014746 TaxID=3364904 RepID=UPI0036F4EF77